MSRRILTAVVAMGAGVLLVLGVLYGWQQLHKKDDQYPLLAKRLFLENPSDVLINFDPLRKDVKQYLNDTGLTHSFYFEYLFTGSNIRAGGNNRLVGASLMKIPIVMDLYKAAELGKLDLDSKVTIPESAVEAAPNDVQFGNQHGLQPGDSITLREAAKIALVESDNTAAFIVFEASKDVLPPEDQAINNLDVETRRGEASEVNYVLIDSRSYASFLKCLYYSCFLSVDHSQEILGYLTGSADGTRLQAGVPEGVDVAHKIGSFSDITQSDCGIVYVPDRRYLLCVMLDADTETASGHIQKISEMVYNYVTSVN